MGLYVTRQSDGSIQILAEWHSSAGMYSIYDGDPEDPASQPIPGLNRISGSSCELPWCLGNTGWSGVDRANENGCDAVENVAPGAVGTLSGVPCNP